MRAFLVAGAVAGLLLTGCSTSTTSPAVPPTDASGTPMSPQPTLPGQVLPPIPIDGQKKNETVKVGDVLNVVTDGVTEVSTDNAEVLEVSQPRDDGLAQFNGGAKVLAPGSADLVVTGEKGELYTVVITATQ